MPLTARDIEQSLFLWDVLKNGRATLLNFSENHTFRIDTPSQGRFSLRVHREGYQSHAAIESELAWLTALRRDTEIALPDPVCGLNGQLLQRISTPDGERLAVLFRFIDGVEPSASDDLTKVFETVGSYAAQLHTHAERWDRPAGFERPPWDAASILDADGLWGNWRTAPGVGGVETQILQRLDDALRSRLLAYGTAADRFGLIHTDMRLGNLLVDGAKVTLIDFDDCGFCWFAYDFAAAISFHETETNIAELKAAWLSGYQRVRKLSTEDIGIIDCMVLLRRMALLAWIGSHSDTRLAQTHMPGFARGTVQLAERFLAGLPLG